MAMTVAFWALNTVFVVQAQEASLRFTIQLTQNLESFLRGAYKYVLKIGQRSLNKLIQ